MVQSPWSPNLTDLRLWFMLALCMSLVFGCFGVFFWWVLPISWLSVGHTVGHTHISVGPTSCFLLCSCGQVVLELVFPFVQGFEAFLLLFFSCLFLVILHYLIVFPERSWVELVWHSLPPSPSPVLSCWCYLCWWVSSSRRYPGVHSFYLFFFCDQLEGKAKWFKTAEVHFMI